MEDYIVKGAKNHIHDLWGFDSMRLTTLEEGHAVVKATTGAGFGNTRDFIHGGVLMALCDMTASAAVYSFAKRNVTLQSSFNFTHGVAIDENEQMTCDAHVVHNGRKTVVVETAVADSAGRICVRATFTQFVVQMMTKSDPVPQTAQQRGEIKKTL